MMAFFDVDLNFPVKVRSAKSKSKQQTYFNNLSSFELSKNVAFDYLLFALFIYCFFKEHGELNSQKHLGKC